MIVKLDPLAKRYSCSGVSGVLERFMTHFCLVSAVALAGHVVVEGAGVLGVVGAVGVIVVVVVVLALLT